MNKRSLIIAISAVLFVTAETTLGYLLQIKTGDEANLYRFAAIVLSCVFCLLLMRRNRDYFLIQIGLIFTVFADWFLVIEDPKMQLEGMIYFSLVQLCYGIMLLSHHKTVKRAVWHVMIRLLACAVALLATVLVLGDKVDAVSLVSMFYYANILLNLIVAFGEIGRNITFPIALLLFVTCDTFIGLHILFIDYVEEANNVIVNFITTLKFDIAWAFYLPSQMLIPLSLIESEIRDRRKERKKCLKEDKWKDTLGKQEYSPVCVKNTAEDTMKYGPRCSRCSRERVSLITVYGIQGTTCSAITNAQRAQNSPQRCRRNPRS